MLISILGCPCSGKTTTAAMAFANLKQTGIPTEFITEQARFYIAEKRVSAKLKPKDPVSLSDEDQSAIMRKQMELEAIMKKACGPSTLIVCDSSSLNALMYMSKDYLESLYIKELAQQALAQYDAVYYASPLSDFPTFDPNRVHDKKFADEFDARLPSFCQNHLPGLKIAGALTGTPQQRMDSLVQGILQKFMVMA